MTPPIDSLPDDLESLKRLLAAERAARIDAEAKATSAAQDLELFGLRQRGQGVLPLDHR